jgi:hypothetical protein
MNLLTKKQPNKRTKEAQRRHEAWLLSVGVKGRSTLKGVDHIDLRLGITENAKLSNGIAGNGTKKDANVYTGDYIIGITTTHKSNLQPITSKQQAVDSANMRRN